MKHAIEVEGLTKVYEKRIRAVDCISFTVDEGELYGSFGPNGAGKTTTVKMLLTLMKPPSGTIKILGIDALKSQSAVRQIIGSVSQEVSADGNLTGCENPIGFRQTLPHRWQNGERSANQAGTGVYGSLGQG
jgi:ABC-2 type transport system ATP-binding protein